MSLVVLATANKLKLSDKASREYKGVFN